MNFQIIISKRVFRDFPCEESTTKYNPTTYLLSDEHEKGILGGFYEQQMQKVLNIRTLFWLKKLSNENEKCYLLSGRVSLISL